MRADVFPFVTVDSCPCGIATFMLHHPEQPNEPFMFVLYLTAERTGSNTEIHIAQSAEDFLKVCIERIPDHVAKEMGGTAEDPEDVHPDELLTEEDVDESVLRALASMGIPLPPDRDVSRLQEVTQRIFSNLILDEEIAAELKAALSELQPRN